MRTRLVLIMLVGCSRWPMSAPPKASSPAPVGAPTAAAGAGTSDVRLAPQGEPGRALTVTGVLVRAEDRTPIARHRFLVYQADANGDYRSKDPADERTARLGAHVTTDAAGRFVIRTILPGAYGTPPGDPHLHIEVSGAQPAMHVVYFEGFLQPSTVDWQKTTEQAHIIAVTGGSDGSIAGHLSLPVRRTAR